jgi:hypothetical protein
MIRLKELLSSLPKPIISAIHYSISTAFPGSIQYNKNGEDFGVTGKRKESSSYKATKPKVMESLNHSSCGIHQRKRSPINSK